MKKIVLFCLLAYSVAGFTGEKVCVNSAGVVVAMPRCTGSFRPFNINMIKGQPGPTGPTGATGASGQNWQDGLNTSCSLNDLSGAWVGYAMDSSINAYIRCVFVRSASNSNVFNSLCDVPAKGMSQIVSSFVLNVQGNCFVNGTYNIPGLSSGNIDAFLNKRHRSSISGGWFNGTNAGSFTAERIQ